ncbi:MAG: methyltransferase domain-containing protein [Pseudomonadota bacterium]
MQSNIAEVFQNPETPLKNEKSDFTLDPLEPDIQENSLLSAIPADIIRKAWFTMAHLVLEDNAQVLDVKCGDGKHTYAMAVLNPTVEFIGIDQNIKVIDRAKELFQLPNLQFIAGDVSENFVPKQSLDGVVNSFSLHETYSENNANEKSIEDVLERQFELLKIGGRVFIQDHVLPSDDEYYFIEIPEDMRLKSALVDKPIEHMSDVELLLYFSETARSREDDQFRGFYLEEVPARFPHTRLFRLPAKWAREFLIRKSRKDKWEEEENQEYSFFMLHDFTRLLKNFGARVQYTAPHWDQNIIRKHYNNKIRLFDDEGERLGSPETSTVIVAQKQNNKRSLSIGERRPARDADPDIRITAMRNEYDGKIYDLIARDIEITEILPYYVSDDKKLHVFVHDELPRGLTNTVPRQQVNLDGKYWSGHMTEALSVPSDDLKKLNPKSFREIMNFSKQYFGLKPELNQFFEDGPGFYPAPDCIDENIKTKYLKVSKPAKTGKPHYLHPEASNFSDKGMIRNYDAQQILNAIGVGLLPTSRLEIQILALYEKLGLSYQSWAECPLTLEMAEPDDLSRAEDFAAQMADEDLRYKPSKGRSGLLKTMQSKFVDEGQDKGSIKGLASRDMDFILNEEGSMNTAVVLPLAKKMNGEVMAGVVETYLPVPQRYKGNGFLVSCPSLPLPPDIKNLDMARKYIAEKFEVPEDNVAQMGESFFSHIGVTPQRIYPFVVTPKGPSGWKKVGRGHGVTSFTPLYRLYRLLYLDNYYSFMKVVAMTYQSCLGVDSDMSAEISFSQSHAERKESFVSLENSPSQPIWYNPKPDND